MHSVSQGRPLPQLEGRFLIVDRLGDGGTATVYLSWDSKNQNWCALKLLLHKYAEDEEMRRRFTQEAEALKLLAHPNIPHLIHHDPDSEPLFMVMELARNGSAMDWVRNNGAMPPCVAANVIFQVCQALAEAHAAGIVHRDVKPHNVLLDDDGICKLTDFGIARMFDSTSLTKTGSQIGTFSFMAPEQRSDTKSVDHRADIYSVGASLYTLLTGRTSAELFVASLDDELLADVHPALREVILKATQYRPEDRHASVLILQAELMDALHQVGPPISELPPLVQRREPLPRRPPPTLPPHKEFPEIDKSLGAWQPPLPPEPRLLETPSREGILPTSLSSSPGLTPAPPEERPRGHIVLPYTMPKRPQPILYLPTPTPPSRSVELTPRGPTPRARSWVRPLLAILINGALWLSAIAAFTTLATVLWGAWSVHVARLDTHDALFDLTESLQTEVGVAYQVQGDQHEFEAIYERYSASTGAARQQAALDFVAALDEAVAGDDALVGAGALPQVRKLQGARDGYLEARETWTHLSGRFPGVIAVWMGLVDAP
ncbi:MAG TPA: serine/threonine protein kinase [Deltaproteobacteria bacterium]|nr:serine/threonine protein kinase [Deltaproteobacteria bacterium]